MTGSPVEMPPSMPPASDDVAAVGRGLGVPRDRVVGLGPEPPGDVPPLADLDRLDRLDAHQREGEQGVELAVPVDVAAEADGHAVRDHLDDAADAVALLGRGLDGRDHGLARPGSKQRTGEASTASRSAGVGRTPIGAATPPMATTWDTTSTPMRAQEQLGERPGRHPGRGLAGRGPLERVAGVVVAVLLHGGQVGVARAAARSAACCGSPGAGDISCSHFGHSGLGTSISTGPPSVRPWRTPPTRLSSSRSNRWRGPRPKPRRRRAQLGGDVLDGDLQPGGQPLDDHAERRGRATRRRSGTAARASRPCAGAALVDRLHGPAGYRPVPEGCPNARAARPAGHAGAGRGCPGPGAAPARTGGDRRPDQSAVPLRMARTPTSSPNAHVSAAAAAPFATAAEATSPSNSTRSACTT